MFVKIGSVQDFSDEVNVINVNGKKMFLIYNKGEFKLFNSVCPHQGANLEACVEKKEISCPVHSWKFDIYTGNSINLKNKKLSEYQILIEDNILYVDFPSEMLNISEEKNSKKTPDFKLYLHSHACIEIKTQKFSLLCDPWLEGDAFLGAWKNYPQPLASVEDLQIDAIWISHEHSDHFHEPTLKKFNKNIPVYVPAFPNERMEKKLYNLGFKNVNPVYFGEQYKIAEDLSITTYEPASTWNDAQVLIEIGNFKILNINDSGINHRIAKKIGKVDMIASSFSPGASGYPLTWSHINSSEKKQILLNAKEGMLHMLKQAVELYSAKYLLPFASHFILGNPAQLKYTDMMEKNTIVDVVNFFKDSTCEVLDLLAGDYWISNMNKLVKINRDLREVYDKNNIRNYIMNSFDEKNFKKYYPNKLQNNSLNKEIISDYFLGLNNIPEIAFVENLTMTILPYYNGKNVYELSFEIRDGKLIILEALVNNPNISMRIPIEILQFIIENNESWDEATIGYWCEFSRNPDIYHAEFWRLLQTPYYLKNFNSSKIQKSNYINENSNVAEILEECGDLAAKILGRYGLYCMSCSKAIYENLELACNIHGIDETNKKRMIQELNILYNSTIKI